MHQMLSTAWAWVASHPYLVTTYVVIFITSASVRTQSSARFIAFEKAHPALGGALHVVFGVLANADQVRRGLALIWGALIPTKPGDGAAGPGDAPRPPSPPAVIVTAIGLLLFLTSTSCAAATPGSTTPTLDKAVAGVVLGARVVHGVDEVCGATGEAMRKAGDVQGAADLTGACAMALRDAADSLDAAALALAAGRAGADKLAVCAIAKGTKALVMIRPILERHGAKLGAIVDGFATFAAPWLDVAASAGCPS